MVKKMNMYDPSRDPRLVQTPNPNKAIESIEPAEPVGPAPEIDSMNNKGGMEMCAPKGDQPTWPGANISGVPADWIVIPPPPKDMVEHNDEPQTTRKRVKKTGPTTRSKTIQNKAQASGSIIQNTISDVIDLTQDDSLQISVEMSGSPEAMDVDEAANSIDETAETVLDSIEDNHDSATTKHNHSGLSDTHPLPSSETQPGDSTIDPSGTTIEPRSRSSSDSTLPPPPTWEEEEAMWKECEEEEAMWKECEEYLATMNVDPRPGDSTSPSDGTTKRKKSKSDKRRKKRAVRKGQADEASEAGTSAPATRSVPTAGFSPACDNDDDASLSDNGGPSTPPRAAARQFHPATPSPKAPLFTAAEDRLLIDASLRGETYHSISTLPGLQSRSAQSVDKRLSKLVGLARDELALPANWKGHAGGEQRAWRPEEDSELLRWKRDGCVALRTDIFEQGRSREAMRERIEHLMVTRGMGAGGVVNERWVGVGGERGRKKAKAKA